MSWEKKVNLFLNSSSSAIIDVVALSLLVVFAVLGLKNGFIKTFVKVFGTIISLLIAVMLCSKCANFLENQFGLISKITEKVSGVVSNIFGDEIVNMTLGHAQDAELSELGLSGWLIKIVMQAKTDGTIPLDTTLNQIISPVLSYYIACGISVIFLFILLKIILFIIGDLTEKLGAIYVVGALNKALGFILGLIRGVVMIQFAVIIIKIIPLGFIQSLYVELNNSVVVGFIDKINLFDIIINSFAKLDILSFIKSSL